MKSIVTGIRFLIDHSCNEFYQFNILNNTKISQKSMKYQYC